MQTETLSGLRTAPESVTDIEEDVMNVILVGFMGTGKSTVAKELSARLGLTVREMDEEIVQAAGRSIPEIFADCGEEGFRDLESQVLDQVLSSDGQVISGGGGVVLRKANRARMKAGGTVVLLTAKPETVFARAASDPNRPNLNGRRSVSGIAELMEARQPAYEAACDFAVATDDKSVREITDEIVRYLDACLVGDPYR